MTSLRCRDDADVEIGLVPNETVSGFRERGTYSIDVPFAGARLFVDDAQIEAEREGETMCWRWQPGFYAGVVVAELVGPTGLRLGEYRLDVSPDASKLGSDVFSGMLDDLYAFNPALLLGTESAQGSFGVAGDRTPPLVAYARLRRYGEALLASLGDVVRQPVTRLRRERALVPYHRIRRLDAASARTLLRNPAAAAVVHRDSKPDGGALPLFDVMQSTEDLDNPANRTLAAMLLGVRRQCVRTADALARLVAAEEDSGARTAIRPRSFRKFEFLDQLVFRLSMVLRREPFLSVTRPEVTGAGLNATSAHPAYARACRFAWLALRPGVGGPDRDENLWLSPTWEVYERWCFTRLVEVLQRRYPELAWGLEQPGTAIDCLRMRGTGQGLAVDAWLQPKFRAGDAAGGAFRSVSGELRPDLLVTVDRDGARKMLVLDAKYRTSRPNVLDAMRSAHIYQDALRWDGARPDASLLLIPRGGGAPWLEDVDLQRQQKVGIGVLEPGETSALDSVLTQWL